MVVASAGCASKVQARTALDRPPLDPPPPPPRVIAPSPLEASETIDRSTGGSPANAARPPSAPRPATPAPAVPGRPETAKPEAATAVPEKTDPGRPDSGVRLLQTTPRGNEAEAEKSIRALLTTAGQTLGRVDYRSLKADARAQYNTAKRFMQQAEDALKAKNFAFAETLADKALELARSLK